MREFATRNRVLHDWLDADDPRTAPLLAELAADASAEPIVILGGGKFLQNPSNSELAGAVGLHESRIPAEKMYDLVVIGAERTLAI